MPRKDRSKWRCRNQECQKEFTLRDTPQKARTVACPRCGSTDVETVS